MRTNTPRALRDVEVVARVLAVRDLLGRDCILLAPGANADDGSTESVRRAMAAMAVGNRCILRGVMVSAYVSKFMKAKER